MQDSEKESPAPVWRTDLIDREQEKIFSCRHLFNDNRPKERIEEGLEISLANILLLLEMGENKPLEVRHLRVQAIQEDGQQKEEDYFLHECPV